MAIVEQEQQQREAKFRENQAAAAVAHKNLANYRVEQVKQAGQQSVLPLTSEGSFGSYTIDSRTGYVAYLMAKKLIDTEMTVSTPNKEEEEGKGQGRGLTRQEKALMEMQTRVSEEEERQHRERERAARAKSIFGADPFGDSVIIFQSHDNFDF